MKAEKIRIELGLEKQVNVAHITDIHLCLADERDAHLIDHAKERANVFYEEASCPEKTPSEYFREALEYSEKNCDTCVITGDVIDFISAKNLEESEEILSGKNYMFTAGNHEFCPRVGVPDSFARKADVFEDIQSFFNGNMFFESRILGGVNLVTIDNSYYNYSAVQIKMLKAEIEKGLPIIIFSHVPLSDPILKLDYHHRDLVPDEYMMEQNRAMLELIKSSDLIKAVFSGHWQVPGKKEITDQLTEYITPGLFKGVLTHIEIV
ncbi:MAG: metallophosphoesterase [Oscillospiraceae bacterium]|nr:metallophosphoesterase [Oscillospiraceae bacterium]